MVSRLGSKCSDAVQQVWFLESDVVARMVVSRLKKEAKGGWLCAMPHQGIMLPIEQVAHTGLPLRYERGGAREGLSLGLTVGCLMLSAILNRPAPLPLDQEPAFDAPHERSRSSSRQLDQGSINFLSGFFPQNRTLIVATIWAGVTLQFLLKGGYFTSNTDNISTYAQAIWNIGIISIFLLKITQIALFVTTFELGLGFLTCMNSTAPKNRTKVRTAALAWAFVLFVHCIFWFGSTVSVVAGEMRLAKVPSGKWRSNEKARYASLQEEEYPLVGLQLAIEVFLLVSALTMIAFSVAVVVKAKKAHRVLFNDKIISEVLIKGKQSAILFLVANAINFMPVLYDLITYVLFGMREDAERMSLAVNLVVRPFFEYVPTSVALTLVYIIGSRGRSNGLWSTKWFEQKSYGAAAASSRGSDDEDVESVEPGPL
ncbi:hypothetical protein B0H66DRAFT_534739 [Apodospora peruviana]|uniref:Uncharacterized protein n=1 Tax=Apodospora peruviana TaxID=516989 RepID=A0AAE0M3F0_9PEZI|nr:hypothetical protein B0H66DRAFT_534739 [Apodospora peruviana]